MTQNLATLCDELREQNTELLRPRRVLLIEDDAPTRALFALAAKTRNCVLECARDGAEGEQMALAGGYDLFCIDEKLPKKTGVEIFRRIAQDMPKHPPVVFFSGYIDFEITEAAAKIGFSAWVPKGRAMDATYFDSLFETFGIKTLKELGLPPRDAETPL